MPWCRHQEDYHHSSSRRDHSITPSNAATAWCNIQQRCHQNAYRTHALIHVFLFCMFFVFAHHTWTFLSLIILYCALLVTIGGQPRWARAFSGILPWMLFLRLYFLLSCCGKIKFLLLLLMSILMAIFHENRISMNNKYTHNTHCTDTCTFFHGNFPEKKHG